MRVIVLTTNFNQVNKLMVGFKKMGIFGVKNLLINQIQIQYQLEKVTMIFAQQLMKSLILILK